MKRKPSGHLFPSTRTSDAQKFSETGPFRKGFTVGCREGRVRQREAGHLFGPLAPGRVSQGLSFRKHKDLPRGAGDSDVRKREVFTS